MENQLLILDEYIKQETFNEFEILQLGIDICSFLKKSSNHPPINLTSIWVDQNGKLNKDNWNNINRGSSINGDKSFDILSIATVLKFLLNKNEINNNETNLILADAIKGKYSSIDAFEKALNLRQMHIDESGDTFDYNPDEKSDYKPEITKNKKSDILPILAFTLIIFAFVVWFVFLSAEKHFRHHTNQQLRH